MGAVLAVAATLFYWWAGPDHANTDSHVLVAAALLEGGVRFGGGPYNWLELVPQDGGYVSPFPVLPALLFLIPVAAGWTVDTNLPSAIVGGLAVWLMWSLLGDLRRRDRLLMTIAFAVGSELLWLAASGGQHAILQMLGATLVLAALRFAHHPIIGGFFVGLAAMARLPSFGASVLVASRSRQWIRVGVGLAVPLAVIALYNVARFGSPFEFGYGLIASEDGHSVLDEPWYASGLVSLDYLPRGLETMLLRGFDLVDEAPWLRPNWAGASILLTMPVLLWTIGHGTRWEWLSIGLIMAPNLLHGVPGFAQFGYRFIVDALPLLWLILAARFRDGIPRPAVAAFIIGIAVNLYGLWAIWGLGFVSY